MLAASVFWNLRFILQSEQRDGRYSLDMSRQRGDNSVVPVVHEIKLQMAFFFPFPKGTETWTEG